MSCECHVTSRYSSKQCDIYDETVRMIIDAVLQGYNGKIRKKK